MYHIKHLVKIVNTEPIDSKMYRYAQNALKWIANEKSREQRLYEFPRVGAVLPYRTAAKKFNWGDWRVILP